jgi:hypothetical protein
MDSKPIKISIDDNRAFAQVASQIDREVFIEGMVPIISKYQLQVPLKADVNKIALHLRQLVGTDKKDILIAKKGMSATTYLIEYPERLLDYMIEHNTLPDKKKDLQLSRLTANFFADIKNYRRNMKCSPIFDSVIVQVLLFREVFCFNTAYPIIFNEPPYPYEAELQENVKRNALFAIIVTPSSTERDVKKAMQIVKKDFVKLTGTEQYPACHRLPKDTITNIKRNRKWYWLNKKRNGMSKLSYEIIAKKYNSNKWTVRFAIQEYKKLLASNE